MEYHDYKTNEWCHQKSKTVPENGYALALDKGLWKWWSQNERKTWFHEIFKTGHLSDKKESSDKSKLTNGETSKTWISFIYCDVINLSSFAGHILVRIECSSLLYSMHACMHLLGIKFAQ